MSNIYELSRLKPNAKPEMLMIGRVIKEQYAARLGRHTIKCVNTGKTHFDTPEQAIEAAKAFQAKCREAVKEETKL